MIDQQTVEQEYYKIVKQIKELEAQKDILNAKIMESMNNEGITNNKTDFGTFLLAWRKTYQYSTDITFREEILKEDKKREETNGTAVIDKQTSYLRFNPKQEVKNDEV